MAIYDSSGKPIPIGGGGGSLVSGKRYCCFGDSIAMGGIPEEVATLTGAIIDNFAVGGSSASERGVASWDEWCFKQISDSIASGDWSAQAAAHPRPGTDDIVGRLRLTDFAKLDGIILMYGYNDPSAAALTDALEYAVSKVLIAYPNLRIIVCSCTYATNQDTTAKTAALAEFARENSLQYIDNSCVGITQGNSATFLRDGTHPNDVGNKLIARNMARNLI